MQAERTNANGFTREIVGGPPMSEEASFRMVFDGYLGLIGAMGKQLGVTGPELMDGEKRLVDLIAAARALRFAEFCGTSGVDGVNGRAVSDIATEAERDLHAITNWSELLEAYASALESMPYAEYLCTPEWHDNRFVVLALAGKRCQVCNQEGRLNVHHRTYERRGLEQGPDLTALCRKCHANHHGKPT